MLVVRKTKEGWEGLSDNDWLVKINTTQEINKGEIRKLVIITSQDNYLVGEITDLPIND